MKNLCAKTRDTNHPYEIWKSQDGQWTWKVLKKYQADDAKPYARWFCDVTSPFTYGGSDLGDCYVKDVKSGNIKVWVDPAFLEIPKNTPAPVEVRPVAYPSRQGRRSRTELAGGWEKVVTPNSVSVHPIPEAIVLEGTPNPEAFLRGDALDRFFKD